MYDAVDERGHVVGENVEECFAFFRRGEVGLADVAGRGAFARDPAAGGGGEGRGELDRRSVVKIADEVWGEVEHHRGLPLAGVAHLALGERGVRFPRAGAEAPVSGEEE